MHALATLLVIRGGDVSTSTLCAGLMFMGLVVLPAQK